MPAPGYLVLVTSRSDPLTDVLFAPPCGTLRLNVAADMGLLHPAEGLRGRVRAAPRLHTPEPHNNRGLHRSARHAQDRPACAAKASTAPKACALPLRYTPTVVVLDLTTELTAVDSAREPTPLRSVCRCAAGASDGLADAAAPPMASGPGRRRDRRGCPWPWGSSCRGPRGRSCACPPRGSSPCR